MTGVYRPRVFRRRVQRVFLSTGVVGVDVLVPASVEAETSPIPAIATGIAVFPPASVEAETNPVPIVATGINVAAPTSVESEINPVPIVDTTGATIIEVPSSVEAETSPVPLVSILVFSGQERRAFVPHDDRVGRVAPDLRTGFVARDDRTGLVPPRPPTPKVKT